MIEGNRAYGHADAQPLGALGDGRGVDLRGGDEPVGGEEMLGDPDLVVAQPLRQLEEGEIVIEALHHTGEIGELAEAEYAEFRLGHRASSGFVVDPIVLSSNASVKPHSCS